MPVHQFSTPRVVYLGLAYGDKEAREAGSAARAARGPGERPVRGRVAMRRSTRRPPSTVR
jgi:hypothetical protein